ncbi:Zn(2)-C6 fungal-type DNA-binding domain protein [Niveomyces insectorum RCEF 264]|uniref:Zn(2)-C6 fungal-type DNA-binding domain protein n=1 Tax=Niveomyces insectorum RCEF 264 TaxID=1081102 RepID=A0A167YTT6_9HYPO|nr:Zn(2)-C6 fungal-type DNA-binding domain protein [Niveomyces insectorum RCEF 264]
MWGPDNNYSLSLRLSCDRCRIQKLKCSMPPGGIVCERCQRAKVACVFGRRVPSRRALNNARARRFDYQQPNLDPALAPTERPSGTTTTTTASETPAGAAAGRPPTPIAERAPTGSSAPGFEPGSFTTESGPNDMALGLHDMMGCDSDTHGSSWLQPEILPRNPTDTYDAAAASLDALPWSQLASLATAAGSQVADGTTVFGGGGGGGGGDSGCNGGRQASDESRNGTTVNQQMTALIAEVQQLLQTLESSPWQTNSADSLDDYPVGMILTLSQQFGSLAGPACLGSEASGESPSDKTDSVGGSSSSIEVDALTMMLVMCGYMLLAHLYDVVLDHFQSHLSHMPPGNDHHLPAMAGVGATTHGVIPASVGGPSSGSGSGSSNSNSNSSGGGGVDVGRPALSLSELSFTNATLSLHKIHVAVGMLLSALHEVKTHFGFEVATARDMAVNLLLTSRRCNDGCLSDLGDKATAVKELIREKMGF